MYLTDPLQLFCQKEHLSLYHHQKAGYDDMKNLGFTIICKYHLKMIKIYIPDHLTCVS